VIRHSWNAMCEFEGLSGQGFYAMAKELTAWGPPADAKGKPKKETPEQVEQRIGRIRGTTLRAVFCAMLRDERPGMTLREAGDLMDELGVSRVFELVNLAFERGKFAESKDARPTIAPNGKDETAIGSTAT